MTISTIEFTTSGYVRILDQRLLPGEETYADLRGALECRNISTSEDSLETLASRHSSKIVDDGAIARRVALATKRLYCQYAASQSTADSVASEDGDRVRVARGGAPSFRSPV